MTKTEAKKKVTEYLVAEHILNFSVQQMADICIPIIFHLADIYSYEEFKEHLTSQIIGK